MMVVSNYWKMTGGMDDVVWVTASSNHPRVPKVVQQKTNFWNPWMVRGILSTARVG